MTVEDADRANAKWQQIARDLVRRIEAGEWSADGRLPTVMALADRYQVNRHTVRRAMDHLRKLGRVSVTQGRGTFVADPLIDHRLGARVRLRGAHPTEATHFHSRLLSHQLQRLTLVLNTTTRYRDIPISMSEHRLPLRRKAEAAGILTDLEAANYSFTTLFSRRGAPDYRRQSTRISAVIADPEQQRILELDDGVPLLRTEGIDVDADGQTLQTVVSLFPANRVVLRLDDDS